MTDATLNTPSAHASADDRIGPVLDALDADRDGARARLFDFLRIPSISTDPAYAVQCAKAADWLVGDLAGIGFEATAHATGGHPIVLATQHDAPGPHLLFYGHYDVQPVDPLELWESDPFDPQIVDLADGGADKAIRARGASDDKGQVMTFVEACRAYRAVHGALPCKITILVEGEEESGGKHLPGFLEAHADDLRQADVALVCDTGMWDADTPAITTMLRGMLGEEVVVQGPDRDLHSGFYGGAAANPITVLSQILGALHDADGRVQIPGFYDGVPEMPATVMAQWDALPFDPGAFLGEIGLSRPWGEQDRSVLEQTWSRPTAEVNGIWGGYTGAGFKTVIPSTAHAKLSFRLVGQQDPEAIRQNFRTFVRERLPADCTVAFHAHGASPGTVMPIEADHFEKTRAALTREWDREAAFIGCGGSIPVVGEMQRILGLDTLLVGFGLADDRIHSPNEKYQLRSFEKGARSWARILDALA
ncbi:MAG: M20/M25/M40 family metallo-hydrolase [Pseudomonadota bacterium]